MWGYVQLVPETNRIYKVYSVADTLQLQYTVHVMLLSITNLLVFYISSSRTVCAVFTMAVFCIS